MTGCTVLLVLVTRSVLRVVFKARRRFKFPCSEAHLLTCTKLWRQTSHLHFRRMFRTPKSTFVVRTQLTLTVPNPLPPPNTHISQSISPKTSPHLTAFTLNLHKIENFPTPPPLTLRLANHPSHSLKYSLSMSFYHVVSKRFFGSTWMGSTFDDSSLKKNSLVTNEMIYWSSYLSDPNCFAVIELVATEYHRTTNVTIGQYGCGWATLQPFGDVTLKDVGGVEGGEEGFIPLKVYGGTPRKLRFLTREDYHKLDEVSYGWLFGFAQERDGERERERERGIREQQKN